MLGQRSVRIATRIAMLSAVPGMNKRRAADLVDLYPTFGKLRAATVEELAMVETGAKRARVQLGDDVALAVYRALR